MAGLRKRIQDDAVASSKRWRKGLILAMIVIGILTLAWFDGGEEAIRPISQELTMPESV